jgi:hypothetical protein
MQFEWQVEMAADELLYLSNIAVGARLGTGSLENRAVDSWGRRGSGY